MSQISLSSVVNANFLRSFQGSAKGSSSPSNALRGGSGAVSLGATLEYGARTYGAAVGNLNSLISFLNISQAKLGELLEKTDDMLQIVDRATRRGISTNSRIELDKQFRREAENFLGLIEEAKVGSRDILSKKDLQGLFTLLGLDAESSETIASVFEGFLVAKGDEDALASEKFLAPRPIKLPLEASTEIRRVNSGTYSSQTVGITQPEAARFLAAADVNNDGAVDVVSSGYTSGANEYRVGVTLGNGDGSFNATSLLSISAPGDQIEAIALADVTLDGTPDLLAIVQGAGSSLVSLYRSNGDGTFGLLDGVGAGTFSGSNIAIGDINNDGQLDLAVGQDNGVFINLNSGSTAPLTAGTQLVSTLTSPGTSIHNPILHDLNGDGALDIIATYDNGLGTTGFGVAHGNGDGSFDMFNATYPTALGAGTLKVADMNRDFIPDVVLAAAGRQVTYYQGIGDGTYATPRSLTTSLAATDALEIFDANADGALDILYNSTSSERLTLVRGNGDGTFRAPQTLTTNMLTTNADALLAVDVNRDGAIDVVSSSSVLSENIQRGNTTKSLRRIPIASESVSSIFDETRSLANRPDAFRIMTDLKELRKQLSENQEQVGRAMETVQQNVELIRAVGLSMLRLSTQISSSAKADEVAQRLRQEILKNAGAALAQAENLEPITVATLTLTSADKNK